MKRTRIKRNPNTRNKHDYIHTVKLRFRYWLLIANFSPTLFLTAARHVTPVRVIFLKLHAAAEAYTNVIRHQRRDAQSAN